MKNINSKFFDSIEIETGETIPFDMANWPTDENGNPVSKQLCQWDEINEMVILKTQSILDKELAIKELPLTDAKMPRALEDVIDLLITKNTIIKADLPQAVQTTYDLKKSLRATLV